MALLVALIGYGSIAQDLLSKVQSDPYLKIHQILVRSSSREAAQERMGPQIQAITSVDQLDPEVDFVLECAGHLALSDYGQAVLARGIDLGILSTGALSDNSLAEKLTRAAEQSSAKIVVVPGAIGGIDAISSVGKDQLSSVRYIGRKAPKSWKGTPAEDVCDLDTITGTCEVFKGNARDAARLFPKNANVVATVALAGLGFEETTVSLIADPAVTRNTHRVQVAGDNVSFDFETSSGTLPNNPRTSALTSQSAYRILKLRAYPLAI